MSDEGMKISDLGCAKFVDGNPGNGVRVFLIQ